MATDWAVMPSTESIGRRTTESGAAPVPSGISTTGNCQMRRSKPLECERRRTMASACRRRTSRSGVRSLTRTRRSASGAGLIQRVERVDTQHGRVTAAIALHADGVDRQDVAVGGGLDAGFDLGTETADGQTGSGKRVAVEDLRGQPEFPANLANLILIVSAEGLHDATGVDQPLYAGHAVVVRLDDGGLFGSAGFDGVRIDGALAENPVAVEQMAGFDNALLHAHEFFADDVAFPLGVAHPGERAQEPIFGGLHREAGYAAHGIGFALAHQAGIDINSLHTFRAEGALAERAGDRGIDPSADEEENIAIADALANFVFDLGHAMERIPIAPAIANAEQEVGQDLAAARGVHDFGMELHAVEAAGGRFDGGDGTSGGAAQDGEPGWHGADQIAMAHPDLLRA